MKQLIKTFSLLHYNDENYTHAVNYTQSMYNYPITLNYGEKHDRTKYIISAGTCDHITVLQDGVFIYVLSQNNGLNYISLQVIDTELKGVDYNIYLSGNDIDIEGGFSYGIMDMNEEDQLKNLLNYCDC